MMQSDLKLDIQTPENIAFGYNLAGLGSRFLSSIIDTFLLVVILIVANLVAIFAMRAADLLNSTGWAVGIFITLNFLLLWGYYIVFETLWNGQTPGKRYVELRVVDRNGVPAGLAASIIRNLVRIVDFFPALYGLGILVMFVSKQQLRLGDMAAGTVVVHDRDVALSDLGKMKSLSAIPAAAKSAESLNLPTAQLSEADIEIAHDYLERRQTLGTERQLLRPILQHLYDQMGVELEDRIPYQEAVTRLGQIVYARRGV